MANITTKLDDQIIINSVNGMFSSEELVAFIQENVETWVGRPVLWKVNKASFSTITTEEWKRIPHVLAPFAKVRKGDKTALVAGEDFPFGMLRMFEILAENEKLAIQFKTFRDIHEAKAWLASKD